MPTERLAPPPGASPPMRMTASWSGPQPTYRIQVCGVKIRLNGELPSDQTQTGTVRHPNFAEKAISRVIVLPRAQASKRCKTRAPLGGKEASIGDGCGP